MNIKSTLIFGGIALFIAVILGALGAHYLRETLAYPASKIASWKTGVQYQQIHGLALILLAILQIQFPKLKLKTVSILFKAGTVLFSGSIYLLAMNYSFAIDFLPKIFGPLTPLGGLLLISGWLLFIINLLKVNFNNE
ncbi:MAG: DUF423 domain-containing protein [Flavobacteriales bacterium]|jgi:uncharacterized membrane protein YgdD (TMEM256/DUF423 family)|nr:DUF423 domain-containing protein [Flavobacteriales bacterium]